MTKTRFCYTCRVHHPVDQMQEIATRNGMRWRCTKSIAGAKSTVENRDRFGREQSDAERKAAELAILRSINWTRFG